MTTAAGIVGQNIKLYREYHGLSQQQLAGLLQVSSSHLCYVEKGLKDIKLSYLDKFARFFRIPVQMLFEQWESPAQFEAYLHTGRSRYRYRVKNELCESPDIGRYFSYSIVCEMRADKQWVEIGTRRDISRYFREVAGMARRFNTLQLLPIDLKAAVEDALE